MRSAIATHDGPAQIGAHQVSLSTRGARHGGPALAAIAGQWLLNLVITRGTPPRLEGCRPASRGLTLALMTNTKIIVLCRVGATELRSTDRLGNGALSARVVTIASQKR